MQQPLILNRPAGRGWIVLIGGGEFSFGETREIDESILSRMPEGNRRVAFIPAASGSAEYGGHFAAYLRSIAPDIEVASVPIYRQRDARRGRNVGIVRDAGLIYVGGGVPSLAVDALRDTPALEAILSAAASGAAVGGIGGGASALAMLGMLPATAIQAPYDNDREPVLRAHFADPTVEIGIGIPPRTAVAVGEGGRVEILGEGSLTVMRRPPAPNPE
jgi:cyanophycinase-like exopeptidase